MTERVTVLVLGGAPEAAAIAEALVARGDLHVVVSLAGREGGSGARLEADVRVGGFADAAALAGFMRERGVGLLVDAAEPFAPEQRRHAAEAAMTTRVDRVVFQSSPCAETDDDVWIHVQDCGEAADLLPGLARRVLLDLPAADRAAFTRLRRCWFLLPPDEPGSPAVPLADYEHAEARGATAEQEAALLREHGLEIVVTREGGSEAGTRLLEAARMLSLPVVLVDRPTLPPSDVVCSIDEVLDWVQARLDERADVERRGTA